MKTVLDVKNLNISFAQDGRIINAVRNVSFTVGKGETVALVGESGSGKSVTALATVALLPDSATVTGSIQYNGAEMVGASEPTLRKVRGNDISFIFQEPMTSLNPVYTVGNQIIEAIVLHQNKSGAEARTLAIAMLKQVGIPEPETRIDEYPHQMSGGMKQRVMIAMALSCNPTLLIADEPTTALDVTIQAQILALLARIQKERGMAVMLITHDLGVVAEVCQRVVVMYAGRVAETAPTDALFANASHPYTLGLMGSLPNRVARGQRLPTISGSVPSPQNFPSGCRFRNRCAFATEVCSTVPPEVQIGPGHTVFCHHPQGSHG